jgi:hypothetical protein
MNWPLKSLNGTPVHVLCFSRCRQAIGVQFKVGPVATTDEPFHKAVPESAESRQAILVSSEFEVITGLDEIDYNTIAMKTAQAIVELADRILLICCTYTMI